MKRAPKWAYPPEGVWRAGHLRYAQSRGSNGSLSDAHTKIESEPAFHAVLQEEKVRSRVVAVRGSGMLQGGLPGFRF